jgi:phosphate starvation-inducible protein PhoH
MDECRSELEALQAQFPNNSKISILQICLDLQMNKHGKFSGTSEEIQSICSSLDQIADQAQTRGDKSAVTEALLAKVSYSHTHTHKHIPTHLLARNVVAIRTYNHLFYALTFYVYISNEKHYTQ